MQSKVRTLNGRGVAAALVLVVGLGALLLTALQETAGAQAGRDVDGGHPVVQWFPAIIEVPQEDGLGSFAMGSGFNPGQELDVRLMMGGVDTSVSWLTSPRPTVANDQGAFVFGFEIPTGFSHLLAHEPTTVRVYDSETQELLTTAPLVLCSGADDAEEDEVADEEAEDPDPWCEIAEPPVQIP